MPQPLIKYCNQLRVLAVALTVLVIILFFWMRAWEVFFFLLISAFLFFKALMTERNWNKGLIVKVYGKCEKVTNNMIRNQTVVSFLGLPEGTDAAPEHYKFVLPKRRKIYGNLLMEGSTYYLYFNKDVPGELLAYESAPDKTIG